MDLEAIPTAKEFRDAIESLSAEQQRFAKAFRSMQLESSYKFQKKKEKRRKSQTGEIFPEKEYFLCKVGSRKSFVALFDD